MVTLFVSLTLSLFVSSSLSLFVPKRTRRLEHFANDAFYSVLWKSVLPLFRLGFCAPLWRRSCQHSGSGVMSL